MQLARSGSSVAANCRARSEREFNAKLPVALEEADESVLWLEVLNEGGPLPEGRLNDMLAEAKALLSILGKAEKTARDNQKKTTG